jgi:P-type Cu+ transporter
MSTSSPHEVLQVEGMTCANCAQGIQNVLRNKGLGDAQVSFAIGEVSYTPIEGYSLDSIKSDIQKLGYHIVDADAAPKTGLSLTEKRFLFSLIFTLPLLAHMFIAWKPLHDPLVQFVLSLPVVITGLYHFGKSAWNSLKSGVPNMDVLITIGSASAFIYSIWGTFIYFGQPRAHDFLFFETAATIITLVLLGNVIEQRSVKQTGSAIQSLGNMQATTARRIEEHDGHEHVLEISANLIIPGDLLQVNEGDRIPADGIIISGSAVVNEAILTGESLPVEKNENSMVSGGTIVEKGHFKLRALKAGKNTTLSQIIELVRKAQTGRPDIQRIGDKVSAIFVPAVIGIALLTLIVNYFAVNAGLQESIMRAIAVLVISCPCAMGLATPTAVMAGIGRAAKSGILFRDGKVTEQLAKVKAIVLDKTGTLTTGEFELGAIKNYGIYPEEEIRNMVFSLSSKSSHPISKSLARIFKGKKANIQSIKEQKGLGMEGLSADGKVIRLGSSRLLPKDLETLDHDLFLMEDDVLLASFQLSDQLKPDAAEAIAELNKLGIKTIMLSGDNERKCRAIATELGMDEVNFRKTPEEKLEIVRELSKKTSVAMVGDGINDSPALNLADVGISMSDASEVAQNSAQVILLGKASLMSLPEAVKLSRLTLRTIHQNLFWAFFYNIIAIPVAAAGFLNPMVAAFSMAFSDVVVIGNSILLQFRRIR